MELRNPFIPGCLDDAPLNPFEFRVFCRISRRGGRAYESVRALSDSLRMSQSKVRDSLRALKSMQMIEAKPRPGQSTIYTARPPTDWEIPDTAEDAPESPDTDDLPEADAPPDEPETGEPGGDGAAETAIALHGDSAGVEEVDVEIVAPLQDPVQVYREITRAKRVTIQEQEFIYAAVRNGWAKGIGDVGGTADLRAMIWESTVNAWEESDTRYARQPIKLIHDFARQVQDYADDRRGSAGSVPSNRNHRSGARGQDAGGVPGGERGAQYEQWLDEQGFDDVRRDEVSDADDDQSRPPSTSDHLRLLRSGEAGLDDVLDGWQQIG